MVRAAVLASGDGARLQAILDAVYFKEIPDFELVAVICPQRGCYAMTRALSAGIPAYVVDPELFPNMTSHSMAVANKLKDMDVELVILAGYDVPLGVVPYQFKNRIIQITFSDSHTISSHKGAFCMNSQPSCCRWKMKVLVPFVIAIYLTSSSLQ